MFFYQEQESFVNCSKMLQCTFMPHIHRAVEIVYLTKGKTEVCISDNRYTLNGGEYIVVFPNMIHSYVDLQKIDGYLLFLPKDCLKCYKSLLEKQAPQNPIGKGNSELESLIKKIMNLQKENPPFSKEITEGLAASIFGIAISPFQFLEKRGAALGTTEAVIEYCDRNFLGNLSLETISKELSISKYHISHIFNSKLGISFTDYINTLRINEACHMLKTTDKSITEISGDVGYTTIRSFNRAFKNVVGMTPKNYKTEK